MLTHLIDDAKRDGIRVRIACTHCSTKFEPSHRAAPEGQEDSTRDDSLETRWNDISMAMANSTSQASAADNQSARQPQDDAGEQVAGALPAWLLPDKAEPKASADKAKPDDQNQASEPKLDPNSDAAVMDAIANYISNELGETPTKPQAPQAPQSPQTPQSSERAQESQPETDNTPNDKQDAAHSDAPITAQPYILPPRPQKSLMSRLFTVLIALLAAAAVGLFIAQQNGVPVVRTAQDVFEDVMVEVEPLNQYVSDVAGTVVEKVSDQLNLENPPKLPDVFTPAPPLRADINVTEASFEVVEDALGSAVHVTVAFKNGGTRDGTIDGFSVVLLDAEGKKLVGWYVSGRAHVLAPETEHEITSTLFNPPKDIARASIIYPAQ